MTVELFITILVISASATSMVIELVKNVLNSLGKTYKSAPIAVAVALIVGIAEIFIYYGTNGLAITVMTALYALCMGITNAVAATTSYDLVKKVVLALFNKPTEG